MIRLRFDAEFNFQLDEIYLLTIFMHPRIEIDAKMTEIYPKLSDLLEFFRFFQKIGLPKNQGGVEKDPFAIAKRKSGGPKGRAGPRKSRGG